MRKLSLLVALSIAAPALAYVGVAEDLEKAKCPVSGRAVDAEAKLDYKGASVYFCCPNCPGAFQKDTAKFEPAANAQLFATGQAEQTACPLSGRPADSNVTVKVADADVAFCCTNCQGKAEDTEEKERITLIFSKANFEKAFKVKEKE